MTADAVALPAGYGFRRLATKEVRALDTLEDLLLVWEPPQPRHRYVLGVDVSDGIGQDRSVVDVCRVGTIDRPPEQVAQFVSRWIDPTDLAYVVDAVGRFYRDDDGFEALAAVETNNHGIATQAELQRRCGYQHFFIWRYEDAAPGVNPQTKRVGWYTTSRTRPIILSRFVKSVKTVDEITGVPDYQINSPFTMEEIRDFQTEGALFEAEAAKGATDDTIMAAAIAIHVAETLFLDDVEPLTERRHRLNAERARAETLSDHLRTKRDYINTDASSDEATGHDEYEGWAGAQDTDL